MIPNSAQSTRCRLRSLQPSVPILVGIICLAGCSKEEIKKAYQQAQAQTQAIVQQTQEVVEEQLPETGSLRMEMTPSAQPISTLDMELIQVGERSVVQIHSYDLNDTNLSYPAVLLHGKTNVARAADLVGKTVQCDLYYQTSYSSPILMTKPGGSIIVKFESANMEDNALTASMGTAMLSSSDGAASRIGGGQLVAVVQGEQLEEEVVVE